MKLLFSIICLFTFTICAEEPNKHQYYGLTQETIDILASGKLKEKMLQAKRDELKKILPIAFMKSLCGGAEQGDKGIYKRRVDRIKAKLNNPIVNLMTYAELAYFADCDDLNGIERNVTAGTIDTIDGISEQTQFLLESMEDLIAEEGLSGKTVLDYVIDQYLYTSGIKGSGLPRIYNKLCGRVGDQLYKRGLPGGVMYADCDYFLAEKRKEKNENVEENP